MFILLYTVFFVSGCLVCLLRARSHFDQYGNGVFVFASTATTTAAAVAPKRRRWLVILLAQNEINSKMAKNKNYQSIDGGPCGTLKETRVSAKQALNVLCRFVSPKREEKPQHLRMIRVWLFRVPRERRSTQIYAKCDNKSIFNEAKRESNYHFIINLRRYVDKC